MQMDGDKAVGAVLDGKAVAKYDKHAITSVFTAFLFQNL